MPEPLAAIAGESEFVCRTKKGFNMQGEFTLAGRVDGFKIVVAPFIANDTLVVSQRTFDRIKTAFPEARQQEESPATVRADAPANRQSIPCPACSMHGDEVEKGNYCSNCGRFLG